MDHIVLFSGGIASSEAAHRVIGRFGQINVKLWFFDTLIEDEDLYRFIEEYRKLLGVPLIRFSDGRNPWEVFRDERYMGNSRVDLCSKHLKRLLLKREIRKSYPNKEQVKLYFGLDWSEQHRVNVVKSRWNNNGYDVDFPLMWEPWLSNKEYQKIIEGLGIEIPRLYKIGFSHNNCGGACIKAGFNQWILLYEIFPERYKWHEEKEQDLRKYLRKNVSILRSRKGGKITPVTLRFLRWRIEKEKKDSSIRVYEEVDDSTCSCFVNIEVE